MENNGTFNKPKIPSLKSNKEEYSNKIDDFFKHEARKKIQKMGGLTTDTENKT